jgi:cytochrome c5
MKRYIVSLFLVLVLTGCGPKGPGELVLTEPESVATMSSNGALLNGQQAYEEICAGCHEEGLDGAPRTGNREDWEGRSWLWEAVLFEHARCGYENMPAKGGCTTLDDVTVAKAAEYMMALTYPEMPRG